MNVHVAFLPSMLPALDDQMTVVVFDVLRATTTMAAALASGVREIRIFGSTTLARHGAGCVDEPLLCGEEQCLQPEGFDLGNSPGGFNASTHAKRTVCMSTTNGTRAILAAEGAGHLFTGALVNAAAVAEEVARIGKDVILLCAGTNGEMAAEDVIGAGAVLHALRPNGTVRLRSDAAWMAEDLFVMHRSDLAGALRNSRGGQNVLSAGLDEDIEFAAQLDALNVVGSVKSDNGIPVVRAFNPQ